MPDAAYAPLPAAAQPPAPLQVGPAVGPPAGPPPLWAPPQGPAAAGPPFMAPAVGAPPPWAPPQGPAVGPPAPRVAPQQMAAAAAAPGTYRNIDDIVRNMPPTTKPVARVLFKSIGRNNRIDWNDDTGLVSIDGQPIHGSNIKNIIDDLSRDYRQRGPVEGSMEVGIAMAETDMPETYFGNFARRSQIHSAVHTHRSKPQPYPSGHQLNFRQFPDDDDDSGRRTSSPLKKQTTRRSPQTGTGLPFGRWETLYPLWESLYDDDDE